MREGDTLGPRPLEGVPVLVVDDEPAIARVVASLLRGAGATVYTAASANAAIVTVCREAIEVLLTDVDLGGKDGVQLAREVTAANPAIAVVFMSGRGLTDWSAQGLLGAGARFLAKPFDRRALVMEVAAAASAASTVSASAR